MQYNLCLWLAAVQDSPGLRLVVYNIRYATGTGPAFHLPLPGAGYLRSNRKVLAGITEFIRARADPTSSAWSRSTPARSAPAW